MHCRVLLTAINMVCKVFLIHVIFLFSIQVDACEQPTIIFPAQHDDIVFAKPVISWLPVTGAIDYEISVQSRIPEGEAIAQFTTATTDSKFNSATALSRERAVVSVKVKARCGSAGVAARVSAESERIFFVDVRSTCPVPAGLSSVPMGQFVRVSWNQNPQFEAVEVRSFGGASIGQLERVPRTQNFALIPVGIISQSVIGVRGICNDANGSWQFLGSKAN